MLRMPRAKRSRAWQQGLSIVELLVGIAVGLFVVGGAVKLFVDNLTNNRRMLVETRVNQDLRAAADLIVRDLRRAGYWRNAQAGISTDPAVAGVVNPYRVVDSSVANELSYSYSKDDIDALDPTIESFGVRRSTVSGVGVLQLRNGSASGWQTITDPGTLDIPVGGLNIAAPTTRYVDIWDACSCLFSRTCTKEQFADPNPITTVTGIYFANRPRLAVRQFTLVLSGNAVSDTRVVRQITEQVRVRDDEMTGACPP
jgi:prepilin peptidase dependent protein B